jgi:hypothetical protein
MRFLCVLVLASISFADTTTQPRDKAASVVAQILPDASSISSFCLAGSDVCVINWSPLPGHTIIFTDHAAARQAMLDEISIIETKLEDGTATMLDLRRWARLVMKINGWSRVP